MNDFNRTIQWLLLTEKKNYLKNSIGLAIGFLIAIFLTTDRLFHITAPIAVYQIQIAAAFCFIIWLIAIMVWGARTFGKLQTKHYRSMFMMLPASMQSKYWASVATTLIVSIAGGIAALVCADVVQMLMSLLITGDSFSVVKQLLLNISYKSSSEICALLLMSTWSYSFYLLGATLFRKNHFLFTTTVWTIIWQIVIVLGFFLVITIFHNSDGENLQAIIDKMIVNFEDGTLENFLKATFLIVTLGFTTLNTWLSYRVFSRMQVVGRKYLNI